MGLDKVEKIEKIWIMLGEKPNKLGNFCKVRIAFEGEHCIYFIQVQLLNKQLQLLSNCLQISQVQFKNYFELKPSVLVGTNVFYVIN